MDGNNSHQVTTNILKQKQPSSISEIRKENKVTMVVSDQKLKIRVESMLNKKEGKYQAFEGVFTLDQLKAKLQPYFETLQQLKQYIENGTSSGIKFDIENRAVEIYAKVNTSRSKLIKIAEIQLLQVKKDYIQQLHDIIKRCKEDKQLQQNQSKDLMCKFAEILIQEIKKQQIIAVNKGKLSSNQQKNNIQTDLQNKKNQIKNQLQQIRLNMILQFQQYKERNLNLQKKQIQKQKQKHKLRSRQKQGEQIQRLKQYEQLEKKVSDKLKIQHDQVSQQLLQLKNKYESLQRKLIQMSKIFGNIGEQLRNNKSSKSVQVLQEEQQSQQELEQANDPQEQQKQQEVDLQQQDISEQSQDKQQQQKWILKKGHNIIKPINWIDENCKGYKNLKFTNNYKVQTRNKSTNIIFSKKIIKQRYQFSIRVNKIKKYIGFGIANSKLKNKQLFRGQKQRFLYWSSGKILGDTQKNMLVQKIYEKDVITILIDIKQGFIQWKLNQKIVKKIRSQKFSDKRTHWSPYIHSYGPSSFIISQFQ